MQDAQPSYATITNTYICATIYKKRSNCAPFKMYLAFIISVYNQP